MEIYFPDFFLNPVLWFLQCAFPFFKIQIWCAVNSFPVSTWIAYMGGRKKMVSLNFQQTQALCPNLFTLDTSSRQEAVYAVADFSTGACCGLLAKYYMIAVFCWPVLTGVVICTLTYYHEICRNLKIFIKLWLVLNLIQVAWCFQELLEWK